MVSLAAGTSISALLLGAIVFRANSKRAVNQAFAATFCLFAFWGGCVSMILASQYRDYEHQLVWLRLNTILAAWMPVGLWFIKEAILLDESYLKLRRESITWLIVGITLGLLSFHPTMFIAPTDFGAHPERGTAYFAYIIIELAAYSILLIQALYETRRVTGIKKIELTLLVATFAGTLIICVVINGIGSYLHSINIKQLQFPVFILGSAICAWGMCIHRIYNAREIITRFAHWALSIATFTVLALAVRTFGSETQNIWTFSVTMFASAAITISLDRYLINLLHDNKAFSTQTRKDINALALKEPRREALIEGYQTYLSIKSGGGSAQLHYSDKEGEVFEALTSLYKQDTLMKTGWITPESAARHRDSSDATRRYIEANALGLIIIVALANSGPSLFVTFSRKKDASPYTYPEIQRLQSITELMDNILTRSRLTEQAALQARMEHLAMMSRGLAHDLKNLITPVSSFLIHTEGKYIPDSPEAEVHSAARRSVRIMTDYVREALFFSERLAPKFELVALSRTLSAVVEITAPRACGRNVTVTAGCDPGLTIVADNVLLQRMLANFVSNAIDASPAGATVRLSASAAAPASERIRLQITDHGCGIAPEHLPRIFEAYFTTKEFGDEIRGFGLGLTIAKKIADLHAATISVESRLSEGTTMIVDLPREQPTAKTMEPSVNLAAHSLQNSPQNSSCGL